MESKQTSRFAGHLHQQDPQTSSSSPTKRSTQTAGRLCFFLFQYLQATGWLKGLEFPVPNQALDSHALFIRYKIPLTKKLAENDDEFE
jgi:hypothetical protein